MIDTSELMAQIQRVGISMEELAVKLNTSQSLLNSKINNEEGLYLTVKEATEMAKVLDIPSNQLLSIFFMQYVANKQRV